MNYLSSTWRWFRDSFTNRSGDQYTQPMVSAYEQSQPASAGLDFAMQVSTVWACIDLLSKTVASMPVYVYRRRGERRDLDRDSDLWDLLHEAPNPRHSATEFWRLMSLNYFARGNAYALKTMAGDRVASLRPLIADQVLVTQTKSGALIYTHQQDGETKSYTESQVLHIRGPGNGVVGMSRLDYMRQSVGTTVDAQNHASRTFRQKGRRSGLVTIDRVLSKEQRAAVRANLADMLAGDATLAVLEAGFKYEGLGLSPADLQLLESRRFSVEEICRWFGVPSVMVNDSSQSTTWGSGIGQLIEGFSKFTIRPELVNFEQAIRRQIIPPNRRSRYEIEFGMDALLRANLKDRMDVYARATQNGIYSRNEARQFENLPPVDGGEMLTAQTNLVPLDMLGKLVSGGVSENSQENADATQDAAAQ